MHKEEASVLFMTLGNPLRVKIVKMLYHNEKLSIEDLSKRMDMYFDDLEVHLSLLIDNKLVLKKEDFYLCNNRLVDELMAFIPTKCSCIR
ncbi:MAG: hypothetical protein ACI35S_03440 [Anaeroplasma sp.]